MSPLVVRPHRFEDSRGWFSETWNDARLRAQGVRSEFCQDNQSYSRAAYTLRGLHFQKPPIAQAKLVRCLRGRIFDVAVDIRKRSPTFGQWVAIELSAENGKQLYVPSGYAHGFLTLEPDCEVAYKVDNPYAVEYDAGLAWDDATIGIDWPLAGELPTLSSKDADLPELGTLDCEFDYDGMALEPLREVAG